MGEGSEYGDSGIDGVAAEIEGDGELLSRRCKAMSASFSVYSATESSIFNGSDSGSSSAGGGEGRGGEGGRGVYENFRKELDNQAWVGSFDRVLWVKRSRADCIDWRFSAVSAIRPSEAGTARRRVMSGAAARSAAPIRQTP